MPFVDLPPQLQERVVCSISAAVKYEVPANIILAVAEKEAGKPGQWVRNSNGTHDVGAMQFNTSYLRDLSRYGITADDVAAAGCYA
ncbi:muramidase, partial [Candidatus Accumulibacter phosphatis]|nr:muramidase [Candidatus Accumulibacter contiguus]